MMNLDEEHVMKTVCVGRFLLDIPKSAEVSLGGARVGGWDVLSPIDESEDEFTSRLSLFERELQIRKNKQLLSSLEASKEIKAGAVSGKVFMFDRVKNYYIENGKRVDIEAVSFQSMLHSKGRSFELFADLRQEDTLARKAAIASQFERWSIDQLPERPGFCIGGAFVNEPLMVEDKEFVVMFIGMRNHPDLAIAISTWAGIDPEAPLLERNRNNSVKRDHANRFKDLGTGERTINGIGGGQTAQEVAEFNGTTSFSFQWESISDKKNVFRPRIVMELSTGRGRPGNPVNSSFSKAEALELWERISSSIRDRNENVKTVTDVR